MTFSRIAVLVPMLAIAMTACQAKPHRYCSPSLVEEDGGYFYEKDGGFFYERDGGYFLERDGGYFYEKDGGFFYERDGVSFPLVCRSGVRCIDYVPPGTQAQPETKCNAD